MESVAVTDDARRLWRIRRTVLQMLEDRGYLVSKSDLDMDVKEFCKTFGESPRRSELMIGVPRKGDPTDQILVFFADQAKVGVNTLKAYFDQMENEKIRRGILVAQAKLTPFARQLLSEMTELTLEEFQEGELMVNITEHVLVPKHVVLSSEEKSALLERYKLQEQQLPRMLITDPISRYYGLSRGQVVKIIRVSETAGRYVTYRIVV